MEYIKSIKTQNKNHFTINIQNDYFIQFNNFIKLYNFKYEKDELTVIIDSEKGCNLSLSHGPSICEDHDWFKDGGFDSSYILFGDYGMSYFNDSDDEDEEDEEDEEDKDELIIKENDNKEKDKKKDDDEDEIIIKEKDKKKDEEDDDEIIIEEKFYNKFKNDDELYLDATTCSVVWGKLKGKKICFEKYELVEDTYIYLIINLKDKTDILGLLFVISSLSYCLGYEACSNEGMYNTAINIINKDNIFYALGQNEFDWLNNYNEPYLRLGDEYK